LRTQTQTESFTPFVDRLIHMLCWNSDHVSSSRSRNFSTNPHWCSVHTLLHHAADAVIHGI